MKNYAVISFKGNQYLASEGEEILVDKLNSKPEADVLLVIVNGKVKVGKPKVAGAKVTFSVVKDLEKGKKLYVSTYKSKSRYRRKLGHRSQYTRLLVKRITAK